MQFALRNAYIDRQILSWFVVWNSIWLEYTLWSFNK